MIEPPSHARSEPPREAATTRLMLLEGRRAAADLTVAHPPLHPRARSGPPVPRCSRSLERRGCRRPSPPPAADAVSAPQALTTHARSGLDEGAAVMSPPIAPLTRRLGSPQRATHTLCLPRPAVEAVLQCDPRLPRPSGGPPPARRGRRGRHSGSTEPSFSAWRAHRTRLRIAGAGQRPAAARPRRGRSAPPPSRCGASPDRALRVPWSASKTASSTSVSTPAASSSCCSAATSASVSRAGLAAGRELRLTERDHVLRGAGAARPTGAAGRRHRRAAPARAGAGGRGPARAPGTTRAAARRPRPRRSSSPSSGADVGAVLAGRPAGGDRRAHRLDRAGEVAAQLAQVGGAGVGGQVRFAVEHRLQLALGARRSGRARRARRRGSARRSTPGAPAERERPPKSWRASASSAGRGEASGVRGVPSTPSASRRRRVRRSRAPAAGRPRRARGEVVAAARTARWSFRRHPVVPVAGRCGASGAVARRESEPRGRRRGEEGR